MVQRTLHFFEYFEVVCGLWLCGCVAECLHGYTANWLMCSCVVTLVTAIPHFFMMGLLVCGQTTLCCGFVETLVTAILLVLGQMTLLTIISIAHVAPKIAISLPDHCNCQTQSK
jgi:hypothetical protein